METALQARLDLSDTTSLWTARIQQKTLDELALYAVSRSSSPRTIEISAPFTGRKIGEIIACTADDVREALYRAGKAQQRWSEVPVAERCQIMMKFHDLVLSYEDEWLDLMQIESGKSRRDAFEEFLDVANVARYYSYRAESMLAPRSRNGAIPVATQVTEYRHPVGTVAVISPWNYPMTMAISDAIPAILAGNTVILKPAEQTSFTALRILQVLREAGLPVDVFQIVTGSGPELGPSLIEGADFIHFTGSTQTGREIASQSGAALHKCTLELGGKNPMIVLEDVDIRAAAAGAVKGCFANAGQLCISFERIYVHSRVYNRFLAEFKRRTSRLKLGSHFSHDIEMGSLISKDQLDKVKYHVEDAVSKGARVEYGGKARSDLGPYFFEPTILTNVKPGMVVFAEETFGPVVSVYSFESEDEAIRLANDSEYGLNAAIFTHDVSRGKALARRIHCGTVNINDAYAPAWGSVDAPMGGMKASGIGRRHGREGILKYTEAQTVAAQRLLPIAPPSSVPIKYYNTILTRFMGLLRHIPGIR